MASTFGHGAVVGQPEADTAAVNVLKKGGNAVDAAVTAALLAGVLAPHATGFGGYGGVMLIYTGGEVRCIDFNTVAPGAASSKMYEVVRSDGRYGSTVRGRSNSVGHLAISVPGVLAGLAMALERFGTTTMADALAPTIRACQNGFRVSATLASRIEACEKQIREFPETSRLLLLDDAPASSGDRLKNPNLGKLLEQIADKGVDEFYKGRIADRIVKHVQDNGGILSKEDMEAYEPRLVEPVHVQCAGCDLYSAPLCGAGVSLLQMCRIAEVVELDVWERDAARLAHGMTEAMRNAWLDRYRHFGDPRTVDVPVEMLLSDVSIGAAGKEVADLVSEGKHGQCLLRPLGVGGTVHLSVVDEERNMVSLTLTHGPSFGSFVTLPRMGLLMNGGMSRFDPGSGLPNSVGPGKMPVMNMCPTIVLRDRNPFLTIGASGGTRIPSSVFQVLARRLVLQEDIDWAVSAGRVHSEGNEWVRIDEEFGEAAPQYLKEVGYTVRQGGAAAKVRAIEVDESGELTAVLDPRMQGGREKGY
ncbi:MAG: gamma-glutamyltransferase [Candidatus Latescibacteria bacterium]|nr:gamma-glutamyltransferase [Candidatus Latescibacterota bacterium]